MKRILFLLLLYFGAGAMVGQNYVLIVEHAQPLALLDAYQRSVPETVKSQWPAFLPLVLGKKETLPDGITRVQRVRILGQTYFVILNASAQPRGIEQTGYYLLLKKVRIIDDTVRIKAGKELPLLHPKTKRVVRTLLPGQKLVLLFQFGAYYYIRTWQAPYSFAILPVRYRYRLQKINRAELKLAEQWQNFTLQLQYFLNRKNRMYQKFFRYFQKVTGKRKNRTAPQWVLEKQKGRLIVRFSEPAMLKQWKRSTQIFENELSDLCRQFHFEMQSNQNGKLVIRQVRP